MRGGGEWGPLITGGVSRPNERSGLFENEVLEMRVTFNDSSSALENSFPLYFFGPKVFYFFAIVSFLPKY